MDSGGSGQDSQVAKSGKLGDFGHVHVARETPTVLMTVVMADEGLSFEQLATSLLCPWPVNIYIYASKYRVEKAYESSQHLSTLQTPQIGKVTLRACYPIEARQSL